MDKRSRSGLLEELPDLVRQGVVTQEVADKLRAHYENAPTSSTSRTWAMVAFSVLGTALVGGGIILLLAHNWEQLTRPLRAIIAVTPLLVSSGFGLWFLKTERESTAWREALGVSQTLAIGIAVSLVSQTYNLGGQFREFILVWSLLTLPLAYVLRAVAPAMLYLVGIAVWVSNSNALTSDRLWYFGLFAAILPFLIWQSWKDRLQLRPVLLAWSVVLTFPWGAWKALDSEVGTLFVSGVSALFFMVGTRWWRETTSFFQRPFQVFGVLGVIGIALVLSSEARVESLENNHKLREFPFPVLAAVMWLWSLSRSEWVAVMMGGSSLLVSAVFLTQPPDIYVTVGFNVYLFVLGTVILVFGARERKLSVVNGGMAVLALVILVRFFDSQWGFVSRGVAFILLGMGFLITNWFLRSWKGATS